MTRMAKNVKTRQEDMNESANEPKNSNQLQSKLDDEQKLEEYIKACK